MKYRSTKTTYLEMRTPPNLSVEERSDVVVERARQLDAQAYRFLYNSVGREYGWIDRNLLDDDDLVCIIQDDLTEIYILTCGDQTAGFSELDRRRDGQIELVYFGLFPEFLGQGLGRYFLAWTLRQAWYYRPRRVWVHTCDLDHPAALPNYLKAGFVIYDEQMIEQVVQE